jgi:hypothetical protein
MAKMIEVPAVAGGPLLILRAEGLAMFLVATFAYFWLGFSTTGYFVFFLAPDISFLAYLAGPRAGAFAYNVMHSTLSVALLGVSAWYLGMEPFIGLALIWAAHIGFDRMLGYGLKYASNFQHTHLGLLGPGKASA